MPWDSVKLNDGHTIPGIAFGTYTIGNGQRPVDQVKQAISVGFSHIDTSQGCRNESEVGVAIRESGLARKDIFITAKYSRLDGLDIETSIQNSLKKLGVSYVDLYLIHDPSLALPDIPTAWKQMEQLKEQGLAISIGVCNFDVAELEILLATAKVKPATNQMLLQPYMYPHHKPIIEFGAKHGIITEAYNSLIPMIRGPLDKLLKDIAWRLGATPDQVILAWVKAKGAVVVIENSKKSRLEGYLRAGDLALTPEDIAGLDKAGVGYTGSSQSTAGTVIKRLVAVALVGAGVFSMSIYMGVNLL